MTYEEKEEFRTRLFNLRLQQTYYMMENKRSNPELDNNIKVLKKEYASKLMKEKLGGKK